MKILVLAPHTDDEVIGCGGFIHNRIKKKDKIKVVAFSWLFSGKDLRQEFADAGNVLGVQNFAYFSFIPRNFCNMRQEIRDAMIALRDNTNSPWDWILVPQSNDPHQDHQVITEEAIRIFGKYTLLGYEGLGKSRAPIFDLVVKLDKEDIMAKINAFTRFESQKTRFYYKQRKEFFSGRAVDRGMLIEKPYAEAFQIIRMTM